MEDMEDLSEDDDEETLQLKLQEIQARLKLKALKKKTKQNLDVENVSNRAGPTPIARSNSVVASRAQSRTSERREERLQRSKSQTSIHVPVSPVRRSQPAGSSHSPQRVLLGIDKGLKASDVSLKRAPSLRKAQETDFHPGPYLHRAGSQASNRNGTASASSQDRPKTFSERMASLRAQEVERQEKELRIKKTRSKAFDIDHGKMQTFKEVAVELAPAPKTVPNFSRDEVLNSYNAASGNLARSKTAPNLRSAIRNTSNTTSTSSASNRSDSRASVDKIAVNNAPNKPAAQPGDVSESEASQFEPYSSVHLSKRIVPHKELTRILTGKKTFVIPDILRTVKAPDFSGPDIEEDVVVFGIIASKSEPRAHQQNSNNDKRGKYMIMALTDLKWELDLFLFDSAFEKFWKLTPGTIIAILNPGFMPPPKGRVDTGKFSLVLNSDADTILEIGSARDLGFCKSVKKDGKTCDTWVDKRHTEFCNFHVNLTLEKTHAKRMEVNTMNFGKGRGGGRNFKSQEMTGRPQAEEEKKTRYDKGSHSQIYIVNRTTANLLDDTDYDPDAFHRGSTKEERVTRRILAQERERDFAKKLGAIGVGLGADYMRRKDSAEPHPRDSYNMPEEHPPDAAALGLLGGKAKDVQLSPIKRKRANTASSSSARGWGDNLSKELGRMKNGESLQPVRKKTRFITEKGIREAGRESFGGDAVKAAFVGPDDDDEDDDLDIVRE
jgi:minichromosome maintenance protein 10